MKKNNKGFTLAELLIVVAIIAVLVAIAIPVFTTQLEKSREATDQANLRAAYAQVMTDLLTWDGSSNISNVTVAAKQTQDGWQCAGDADQISIADGISGAGIPVDAKKGGATWQVGADTTSMVITIN